MLCCATQSLQASSSYFIQFGYAVTLDIMITSEATERISYVVKSPPSPILVGDDKDSSLLISDWLFWLALLTVIAACITITIFVRIRIGDRRDLNKSSISEKERSNQLHQNALDQVKVVTELDQNINSPSSRSAKVAPVV